MTAKIYIIALLFIGTLYGQDGDKATPKQLDSVKSVINYAKFRSLIKTVSVDTTPTFRIYNSKGKYLALDFSGDTLRAYGELHPDSASIVFFEYCMKRWINWRTR
jgi:hypothetical protein